MDKCEQKRSLEMDLPSCYYTLLSSRNQKEPAIYQQKIKSWKRPNFI